MIVRVGNDVNQMGLQSLTPTEINIFFYLIRELNRIEEITEDPIETDVYTMKKILYLNQYGPKFLKKAFEHIMQLGNNPFERLEVRDGIIHIYPDVENALRLCKAEKEYFKFDLMNLVDLSKKTKSIYLLMMQYQRGYTNKSGYTNKLKMSNIKRILGFPESTENKKVVASIKNSIEELIDSGIITRGDVVPERKRNGVIERLGISYRLAEK